MTTRFNPPHVDLDPGYHRPNTGDHAPAGWFRQAAYNIDEIHAAYDLSEPNSTGSGWIDSPATWHGFADGVPEYHVYRQTGSIVDGYSAIDWDDFEFNAELALTLPVPPAKTLLPSVAGHGLISGLGGVNWSFIVEIPAEGETLAAIYAPYTRANNIWWNNGQAGQASVQYRYRAERPPEGRMTSIKTWRVA